ncbi:MAG TPA: acyl-CoA dehydrogenase family protein, partial [Acidimicrobiia bacterium]
MSQADLDGAAGAIDHAAAVVDRAAARLAEQSRDGEKLSVAKLDEHQVLAYDLAHGAAAVEGSRVMLEYGQLGDVESMLARAYVADAIWDLTTRVLGRAEAWGSGIDALAPALPFVEAHRAPEFLAALGDRCADVGTGPNHLDEEFTLVADTFRRFGEEQVRPHAEHVHRANADVPESIISGLAEIGGFGLSVPEEYDGFATGGESDYMGMVVSTEELSRASLGIGGSLITRPEILTRAVVAGGTEEQKRTWLPRIASGELLA